MRRPPEETGRATDGDGVCAIRPLTERRRTNDPDSADPDPDRFLAARYGSLSRGPRPGQCDRGGCRRLPRVPAAGRGVGWRPAAVNPSPPRAEGRVGGTAEDPAEESFGPRRT